MSTLWLVLGVCAAGAAGALGRTFLNDALAHRIRSDFPFGILSVNVSGSFLLGLLTGLSWYHGLSPDALVIAGAGFCGGLTTWSTAVWESLQLFRIRSHAQAVTYTLGGLGLAIAAASAGIAVAALI